MSNDDLETILLTEQFKAACRNLDGAFEAYDACEEGAENQQALECICNDAQEAHAIAAKALFANDHEAYTEIVVQRTLDGVKGKPAA